jgi:hypothetical protein
MTDLQAGKYVISARALGFEPATYAETVTVDSGQITTGINFALQLDATLGAVSGHVIDALTQQPIAGAFVVAWNHMLPDSGHHLPPPPDSGNFPPPPPPPGDSGRRPGGHGGPPPGGDSSDASGLYLISYLRSGNYVVSATASGYSSAIYPETLVVVHGQTTTGIDFALQPTSAKTTTSGSLSAAGVSQSSSTALGSGFSIVPNPFHGRTSVMYSLPKASFISLRIYDASGKVVSTVAQGHADAGSYAVSIDAGKMAKGIYFVRLQTTSYELEQKLIAN